MKANVYDIILTTAKQHRVPVNGDLFARCEHELERSSEDEKGITEALVRAFQWHQKACS